MYFIKIESFLLWFSKVIHLIHIWQLVNYFISYIMIAIVQCTKELLMFMFTNCFRALELDCLKNSHPIEVPVGHPSEIDEIFDDISYNKGASVIRMLHKYIGDDDFRKGMNIYLTRHQACIFL